MKPFKKAGIIEFNDIVPVSSIEGKDVEINQWVSIDRTFLFLVQLLIVRNYEWRVGRGRDWKNRGILAARILLKETTDALPVLRKNLESCEGRPEQFFYEVEYDVLKQYKKIYSKNR